MTIVPTFSAHGAEIPQLESCSDQTKPGSFKEPGFLVCSSAEQYGLA